MVVVLATRFDCMSSGLSTRRRKLFARARYHQCKIIIELVVVCLQRSNVTCVPLGYAKMSDFSIYAYVYDNMV